MSWTAGRIRIRILRRCVITIDSTRVGRDGACNGTPRTLPRRINCSNVGEVWALPPGTSECMSRNRIVNSQQLSRDDWPADQRFWCTAQHPGARILVSGDAKDLGEASTWLSPPLVGQQDRHHRANAAAAVLARKLQDLIFPVKHSREERNGARLVNQDNPTSSATHTRKTQERREKAAKPIDQRVGSDVPCTKQGTPLTGVSYSCQNPDRTSMMASSGARHSKDHEPLVLGLKQYDVRQKGDLQQGVS